MMERTMANKDQHPLTPRQKRLRLSIWGSILIGGVIGAATSIMESGPSSGGDNGAASYLDGKLSPTVAVILALVSILAIVPLTIWYHKNADEHEERAVLWGTTVGGYVTITAAFIWTLLYKGGLMPEPDVTGVMMIFCIGSLGCYAWMKYR
jgi:hypothetical protein